MIMVLMSNQVFPKSILLFLVLVGCFKIGFAGNTQVLMFDKQRTIDRLKSHLEILTEEIGERSVTVPRNLIKTQQYIESFYHQIGVSVDSETYPYRNATVANVVAEITFNENPKKRYLLGAHYDSVSGTVGADDNASAIAVQLEVARRLSLIKKPDAPDVAVLFVSFALEEPPVYGTRYMGSRVYARKAKKENLRIDGMICLEMVGYTCHEAGCQTYPFPLTLINYPKEGNFIGVVGNFSSRRFTRKIWESFQKNRSLPVIKLTVPFSGWLLPSVRLSDHASFWDQGYRAVMITDSAFYRNPHYHLQSDTMDTLDLSFMAELVNSLTDFFTATQ